ncbi:hypothetical protein P7C73_g5405, partial [Tremellales sp. Uapishka_1]
MGLNALRTIGSGYEGVFSRRDLTPAQVERIRDLLAYFDDLLGEVKVVERRLFAHFTPPQQGLLLFLRAIVSAPRLLILDEPSQGMDEVLWQRCRELLEEEWRTPQGREQAVVVVSHYEDEVPWEQGTGMTARLIDGRITTE